MKRRDLFGKRCAKKNTSSINGIIRTQPLLAPILFSPHHSHTSSLTPHHSHTSSLTPHHYLFKQICHMTRIWLMTICIPSSTCRQHTLELGMMSGSEKRTKNESGDGCIICTIRRCDAME